MSTAIKTNHHPREVLYWWDLTDREQREFDYLVPKDYWSDFKTYQRKKHVYDDEEPEATFFRYRGRVYDLGEFMCIGDITRSHHPEFEAWRGYQPDSHFSGMVVRWVDDDCDAVVVGSYCF